MRFRVVCLSVPSVPTLCLKDLLLRNGAIHPELLIVRMVRWSKLSGCRQFKDQKNSPLRIKDYLLELIGVTMIYSIYWLREIVALLFSLRTVFIAVIEAQETKKELVIWTERYLPLHSHLSTVAGPEGLRGSQLNCQLLNWLLTPDWLIFKIR